jgi:thymidylate synthase
MALLIEETNALAAWRQGCSLLSRDTEAYNVVTTIADPTRLDHDWFAEHNPRTLDPTVQTVSEVATTIFPFKLVGRGYTRQEFYDHYLASHDRARRIHRKTRRSWGTYFRRLICFGESQTNQLEQAITAIRSWTRNHKAAVVMHTSSVDTDSLRKHTGNPCLQYVELLCPTSNTVSMLAVYRNHDYFHKVLGNFIGLGQLLKFVGDETGRAPGTLVCHSAHAYAESTGAALRRLARLA